MWHLRWAYISFFLTFFFAYEKWRSSSDSLLANALEIYSSVRKKLYKIMDICNCTLPLTSMEEKKSFVLLAWDRASVVLNEVWGGKWGGEWQKPKNRPDYSVLERRGEVKTKKFRAEAWRDGEKGEREMNKYGQGLSMRNSCWEVRDRLWRLHGAHAGLKQAQFMQVTLLDSESPEFIIMWQFSQLNIYMTLFFPSGLFYSVLLHCLSFSWA